MDFHGKRVAVLGFGAEGRAAAAFLLERGAEVSICEVKPEAEFKREDVETLKKNGVTFRFGPGGTFEEFDAIVRSPGVPPHIPALLAARAQGIPVTSGTQIFFEECPTEIVGVTGTKGKGTTSALLHEIMKLSGRESFLVGNIGEPALHALPAIGPGAAVVYELSSFQLMDVAKSPHIAVVLMTTRDHLDYHADEEEYVEAKRGIVSHQSPGDIVVANADYPSSQRIAQSSPAERKYWISRKTPLEEGCYVEEGRIILATDGNTEVICRTDEVALHGAHNLENACAAAMAAWLLEAPLDAIREGITTFKGLPHRLQLAGEKNGARYYDDSISTTPESALAAIRAFPEPKVVILGGSPKGADYAELAEEVRTNESIKAIIGIGEEWPRIERQMANGKWQMEEPPVIIGGLATMQEVVKKAAKIAKAGDIVLLSPGCASFGMFRDYKDRGDQFIKAVGQL